MVSLASFGSSSTNSMTKVSIRLPSSRVWLPRAARQFFVDRRQIEIECGAFAQFSLDPNSATMLVDDALDRRQADPSAFEFFPPVKALEHAEQLARVLHVESDAIIADE